MESLSPAGGRDEKPDRLDAVAQIRDLGERLKHLLTRYDSLVTRVADARVPVPDLVGRIDWLSLQLAAAAEQIQEIIVLECVGSKTVPFRSSHLKARASPRPFVVHRAVEGRA
jgi:hypothetical protein